MERTKKEVSENDCCRGGALYDTILRYTDLRGQSAQIYELNV